MLALVVPHMCSRVGAGMHQTGARARLPELPSSYPVAQPRRDRRLARPRLQRTAVVHGDDDAVGSCQDAMWRLQTSVTNGVWPQKKRRCRPGSVRLAGCAFTGSASHRSRWRSGRPRQTFAHVVTVDKNQPPAPFARTALRQVLWLFIPAACTSSVLRVLCSGRSRGIVSLTMAIMVSTNVRSVGRLSYRLCGMSVKVGPRKDIVAGHCAWS